MSLKGLGVLVALCATLAVAIPDEHAYYYHRRSNDVNSRARLAYMSNEGLPTQGHNHFNNPHSPHTFGGAEEWEHHGFPQPHYPEGWSSDHPDFSAPHFPDSSEGFASPHGSGWGHNGFPNPHYPHASEGSEYWNYHDFSGPYFPDNSWEHHGFPKPNVPHNFEGSAQPELYGYPGPHAPNNLEESGIRKEEVLSKPSTTHTLKDSREWTRYGHEKPHYHHSEVLGEYNHPHINYPGRHKPFIPHTSEVSGNQHNIQTPHLSLSSHEIGGHQVLSEPHLSHSSQDKPEIHRPDWINPHFLQNPDQLKQNFEGTERRRPLFYPIYPYHPFHPHPHPAPSTNDEEFETVEAKKINNYHESRSRRDYYYEDESSPKNFEQQKIEGLYYHGSHNPNFPTNSNHFSENSKEMPTESFPHGSLHPHFNPFHMKPTLPADSDVFEYPNINGDDFLTSQEAQPYGLPFLTDDDDDDDEEEKFQGPFFIISDEDGNLKLPQVLLDILEHFHNHHGKPHRPDHKPSEDENEIDEEGSGEEEIIPLSADAKIPLIQEDITESED